MRFAPLAWLPILLLCTGPTVAAPEDVSEPIDLPPGKAWVHEPSGVRFPPDVGTFTRVSGYRYDDDGKNVSVGYSDAALKLILTAYVYPNGGESTLKHFERVKRDVKLIHPESTIVAEGQWTFEQGGRKLSGRRAAFVFSVPIAGRQREVISEAYLLRLGDHFVKFRATCPREKYEAAVDRVARFFQALKLPEESARAAASAK
jgi:hypothetical protein